MNKHAVGFGLVGCLAFSATQVNAAPITSDSLIHITQFSLALDSIFSNTSTSTYYDNTLITGVSAYGDLSAGTVGSESVAGTGSYQSIVSVFDTLTFDSSANVSFSFTFDGTLSSNSPFDNPYGQGRVDIYDITGLPYWVETDSVFGLFDQAQVVPSATDVSINTFVISMDEIQGYSTGVGDYTIIQPLSHDSTLHDVSHTISGSFEVDPSKTYGIRLAANTYGDGTGTADFLNTGAFEFTDLDGASFVSASGVFPGSPTAGALPLPSAIWLFGTSLVGLIGFAKRKPRN